MPKSFLSILVSVSLLSFGALAQPDNQSEFDANQAIDNATLISNLDTLRDSSPAIYAQVETICTENHLTIWPPFVDWLSQSPECLSFRTLARNFLKVSELRLKSQLPTLEKNWPAYYNSLSTQCTEWKFVFGESASMAWNDHTPNCEAFRNLSIWFLKQ